MRNLFIGIFFLGICSGFLIGASKSPVVGIAITSLFGFIGAFAGILNISKKDDELKNNFIEYFLSNKKMITPISYFLIIYSISLLIGVITGEKYRSGELSFNNNFLVWEKDNRPQTLEEGIDWIMIIEKMKILGYSKKQIQELYSINESRKTNSNLQRMDEGTFDHFKEQIKDNYSRLPDTIKLSKEKFLNMVLSVTNSYHESISSDKNSDFFIPKHTEIDLNGLVKNSNKKDDNPIYQTKR